MTQTRRQRRGGDTHTGRRGDAEMGGDNEGRRRRHGEGDMGRGWRCRDGGGDATRGGSDKTAGGPTREGDRATTGQEGAGLDRGAQGRGDEERRRRRDGGTASAETGRHQGRHEEAMTQGE
jgi:hypothetical protein